jgi:hypothetical protein
MKSISFYAGRNRNGNLLHIETDGCTINIRVGLTDASGNQVTTISVSPDDESRGGDGHGRVWYAVDAAGKITDGAGLRVVRQPEYTSKVNPGTMLVSDPAPGNMHSHPHAGHAATSTHHGHDQGYYPHAHPDLAAPHDAWKTLATPMHPDQHEHRRDGQVLAHEHQDGAIPHGYFGHAEDPDQPVCWCCVSNEGMAHAQLTPCRVCGHNRASADWQRVNANPELYRAAREWIADCWENPDTAGLTDNEVRAGVTRHFDGGWPSFVSVCADLITLPTGRNQ